MLTMKLWLNQFKAVSQAVKRVSPNNIKNINLVGLVTISFVLMISCTLKSTYRAKSVDERFV